MNKIWNKQSPKKVNKEFDDVINQLIKDAGLGKKILKWNIAKLMEGEASYLIPRPEPKIKTYTYGFECPDIKELKTDKQREETYNKILEEFSEQLNEWLK
jgi:hypothetical protein